MAKNKDNVVKFRRPRQLNIGIVICIIIFIYVMFHLYTYLTTEKVTVYEVAQGTIVSNDSYQALAIRDEEIINAEASGFPYYYGKNRSRVGVRSLVYGIDTSGSLADVLGNSNNEQVSFSNEQLSTLLGDIDSYCADYDPVDFGRIYTFKSNLSDSLDLIYSQQLASEYSDMLQSAVDSNTLINYNAPHPGVLLYTIDGYEGITLDDLSDELFDSENVTYTNLRAQTQVDAGFPVYKMINSDNWMLVIRLDETSKARIGDRSAVEIMFTEDESKTWTTCEMINVGGEDYLVMHLDDSVERFTDSRFVNIELMIGEESGLKIPNSAIVTKKFFTVPKTYFYKGDNSQDLGLMVHTDEGDSFVTPTIYHESEDSYYIDSEDIAAGSQLLKNAGGERYIVGTTTDELIGVYNVNKGYAVFKQIEIIYQNEDYSIIRAGTNYGIAPYDHIVLQGDMVNENQIIY